MAHQRRQAEAELSLLLTAFERRGFTAKWLKKLDLPEVSAPRLARASLPALAGRFFEAGDRAAAPGTPARTLHRFRLAAKRLRDSLDLFRPLYGPRLDVLIEGVREIQVILGNCSDCAATLSLLPETGCDAARSSLAARAAAEQQRFAVTWKRGFSQEPVRRRWLRYLDVYPGRTRHFPGPRLDHPPGLP